MKPVKLTGPEKACLEAMIKADPNDEYTHMAFAGTFTEVSRDHGPEAILPALQSLRKRKLASCEGRGKMASFWPTEKGKQSVADA